MAEKERPLITRTDAEIAQHLLQDDPPVFDPSNMYDFDIELIDEEIPDGDVLDAWDEIHAISNIPNEHAIRELGEINEQMRASAGPLKNGKALARRKMEILCSIDYTRLVSALCSDASIHTRPSDKNISCAIHAICDNEAVLSLAMSLKLASKASKDRNIICIPASLLEDEKIAKVYRERIAPKSECIFDQRQHPEFRVSGQGMMTKIALEGGLPESLPVELYRCLALRCTPSVIDVLEAMRNRKRYDGAVDVDMSFELENLLVPSDTEQFKETLKRCRIDTEDVASRLFRQVGGEVCANALDLEQMPEFIQEIAARDRVLSPIWSHVMSLDNTELDGDSNRARLYDEYGIEGYLDAIASGVPLEDLFA